MTDLGSTANKPLIFRRQFFRKIFARNFEIGERVYNIECPEGKERNEADEKADGEKNHEII